MLQMVGGSFTGLTVSEKLLVAVCPSAAVTLMVMVAVPFWFVAGVMTTVRLDPLPLKAMFSLGTSAGLEELHVRTRFVRSEERRVGKSGDRGGGSGVREEVIRIVVGDW